MHHNRRRKKRPSVGIRTVEITRGRSGYGFTISGQAPCILSCIVSCSPAERAGLRPGDYLIAVNGQNVSKAPHDDVVRLIGHSSGILKLQIAENYYSDSSEDDLITVTRSKPKFPNRVRGNNKHVHHSHHVYRAERVVQDLHAGVLFQHQHHSDAAFEAAGSKTNSIAGVESRLSPEIVLHQLMAKDRPRTPLLNMCEENYILNLKQQQHSRRRERKHNRVAAILNNEHPPSRNGKENNCRMFIEQELNYVLYPSLHQLPSGSWEVYPPEEEEEQPLYKAVVGYLGTVEMPKEPQMPGTRLQAIRNCIRRLRVEKKVHTLVLLAVFAERITLTNPHGVTIAEYPADKITFSGLYADDKKFFGLVTSPGASSDELMSEGSQDEQPTSAGSSSCHVFMIDPRMIAHAAHSNRAKMFSIECGHNGDARNGKCPEFPDTADPILRAILNLYRNRGGVRVDPASGLVDVEVPVVVQHSNTSSNSSNSDSGIGFRDDGGHHSDQVFVVDVNKSLPHHRMTTASHEQRAGGTAKGSALAEQLPGSSNTAEKASKLGNAGNSSANISGTSANNSCDSSKLDRLTVRVMPDPVLAQDGSFSPCDFRKDSTAERGGGSHNNNFNTCHSNKSTKLGGKGDVGGMPVCVTPSPFGARVATPVTDALPSNQAQLYKLSPKVYGVEFPLPKLLPVASPTPPCAFVAGYAATPTDECCEMRSQSPDNLTETTENTGEQEGSQDVHPPTQDEDSDYSEMENVGRELEGGKNWMRTLSLRRQFSSKRRSSPHASNESGALSDGELVSGKLSSASSMLGFERVGSVASGGSSIRGSACGSERNSHHHLGRGAGGGRVTGWAISFEKLLEDPAGVQTFAEFLKKEFSHENIYFWLACERYRKFVTSDEMKTRALDIFEHHLCLGAPEAVNVDSHARQLAQEGLERPSKDLFLQAQKQIYNLMKFDCYARFLKSPLYKECLMKDISGDNLPYQGDEAHDADLPYDKHDGKSKSKKDAAKDELDERRRKSLLPWHRKSSKNNSKDLVKGLSKSSELMRKSSRRKDKRGDDASSRSDKSGSRTSLASSDLAIMQLRTTTTAGESVADAVNAGAGSENCTLCRVILPDGATTVLPTKSGDSIFTMVKNLLEKRGLSYSAVDMFSGSSDVPLDLTEDSSLLSCQEVRVEQRVVFRLDLPNKKTIGVKAKPANPVGDVLRPVLQRYGYKVDTVVLHQLGVDRLAELSAKAVQFDKQQLIVQCKDEYLEWGLDGRLAQTPGNSIQLRRSRYTGALDELNNRVFEDLFLGNVDAKFDELGVLDPDKPKNEDRNGAERKSGILGLVRRNSVHFDRDISKRAKTKGMPGNRASVHESINFRVPEKPPIPRRPTAPPAAVAKNNENDELFDIWKRAQRSRLDDQRGTEINFELPDFLKPKSSAANFHQDYMKTDGRASEPLPCSRRELLPLDPPRWSTMRDDMANAGLKRCLRNESFSEDGVLPTPQQAEEFFSSAYGQPASPAFKDPKLTEKSLRDIGFSYHSRADAPFQLVSKQQPPPLRPTSHPVPRFYSRPPRIQQTKSLPAENVCNLTFGNKSALSSSSAADIDVTLKQTSIDETLTPSKLPPLLDASSTSIHTEEANFPPPSPLRDAVLKEKAISAAGSLHFCLRNPPETPPPPLPPKPKMLPPPRPAHPLPTTSVAGGRVMAEPKAVSTPLTAATANHVLLNQKGRSRNAMYVDCDGVERFSISFV